MAAESIYLKLDRIDQSSIIPVLSDSILPAIQGNDDYFLVKREGRVFNPLKATQFHGVSP